MNSLTTQPLTEAEFQVIALNNCVMYQYPARRFAMVNLPNTPHEVGIAWRSHLMEPMILRHLTRDEVWIGIDERIVCIQNRYPMVALSLGLPGYFIDFQLYDDVVIVICETQILALNNDYSIRSMIVLSTIPDRVVRDANQLTITSIEDETITVSF